MAKDIRDFYITWNGHPKYKEGEIIVEDPVRIIINKMEMCLFTNKGEYIGDADFGCNLTLYLWDTSVSAEFIKGVIVQQFDKYIPELKSYSHTINVYIMEGELRDIMVIDSTINDYAIKVKFS